MGEEKKEGITSLSSVPAKDPEIFGVFQTKKANQIISAEVGWHANNRLENTTEAHKPVVRRPLLVHN
jgi:hypothetical protein